MWNVLRAIALAVALVGSRAANAVAAEPEPAWEISGTIPVGRMTGHTTYRISASDGASSIASELEFPLQGFLAGVQVRAVSPPDADGGRWTLEGSLLHTITDQSGTMRDSDWIDGPAEIDVVGAPHAGKDVFSTSKTFLSGLVLEARVGRRYTVSPSVSLSPIAGILYQSFSYDVRDVEQEGYGPWAASMTGRVAGPVLTSR